MALHPLHHNKNSPNDICPVFSRSSCAIAWLSW